MQLKVVSFSTKSIYLLLFILTLTFSGCQKKFIEEEIFHNENTDANSTHLEKIQTWFKFIPLEGKFANIDLTKIKTISKNGQLTTRIEIGGKVQSLYFISGNNKFHVYGINSLALKHDKDYNGTVVIYDFQTLSKREVRYKNGLISGLFKYGNEIINAYKNYYPKSSYSSASPTSRTSLNAVHAIRKFFCELFGGTWYFNAYDPAGPHCNTGGSGDPEEVQEMQPDLGGGGGNTDLGLIFNNLNNPNFFDATTNLWNSITAGLNYGGNTLGWATNNTTYIDPSFTNPDEIRSLYFILNTQYNQQPPSPFDGTLDDILEQFRSYSTSETVAIPIIPWLLKAGANGAADALTQALFIYLTEDNCPSFGAAFGHDKFSKTQVARSAAEGLIPWSTPGGKLGKAAASAMGDVLVKMIEGNYGNSNYQSMGADFMLGFFSDLAGGEIGELASKYSIPKIGKGLITKFGQPYKTVTSWLGGGLAQINKSFTHSGHVITANRVMNGFAEGKVAVIGRSMDKRVVPFADNLSAELGINVITIKSWPGWSANLTVEQNRQWIKELKEQGYTFYDVGLDPDFPPDNGLYYGMEISEIFD